MTRTRLTKLESTSFLLGFLTRLVVCPDTAIIKMPQFLLAERDESVRRALDLEDLALKFELEGSIRVIDFDGYLWGHNLPEECVYERPWDFGDYSLDVVKLIEQNYCMVVIVTPSLYSLRKKADLGKSIFGYSDIREQMMADTDIAYVLSSILSQIGRKIISLKSNMKVVALTERGSVAFIPELSCFTRIRNVRDLDRETTIESETNESWEKRSQKRMKIAEWSIAEQLDQICAIRPQAA